ncbi:MAG TPA: MFS transporter [Candidatus Obscuribacterales bacterium]
MLSAAITERRHSPKSSARMSNLHAFAASWLGETFDAMDAMIYFIVLYPCLAELLKTQDATAIGWHGAIILAIFMIGWSLGSVGFGIFADKFGRRMAMTTSILLYAIGSALCATSQDWTHLAFYRFLVGCGIGGEISIGTVLLSEAWQGKGRIWAMCLMQSSFCTGCLLTGAFNLSVGAGGWRWLFLIGIIPALVAFYIRSQLSEPKAFEAIKEYRKKLAGKPKEDLSKREREMVESPMVPLLKGTNLRKLILATTLCMSAIVGYWAAISWMPAWINQLTGTEAVTERSAATTLMSIGGILVCFICPTLTAMLGRRAMFLIGFAGSLASVLLMYLGIHAYGNALLAAAFAVGVFSSIPFIIVSFYIPELFETHVLGTASGISWSLGRIVAAMAGLLTGPFIAWFGGSYACAASCVATIYLAGIAASLFVREPKQLTTSEVTSLDGHACTAKLP